MGFPRHILQGTLIFVGISLASPRFFARSVVKRQEQARELLARERFRRKLVFLFAAARFAQRAGFRRV